MKEDYKKRNLEIATETLAIIERGWYELNGKKIELPEGDYEDVIIVTPETAAKYEKDIKPKKDDEYIHDIWVFDSDAFNAASEDWLVMNFANACTPGSGFKKGFNGQEESLCRQSTLYKSIGSRVAREMYNYNKNQNSAYYSDYMLISPDVCVFRDIDGNLLESPFKISVISVPALNLKGAAKNLPQEEIDTVMKSRLRKMFAIASECNYYPIILGAWGCGKFGHNPYNVAKYFRELLIDENYCNFFNPIAFAILPGVKNLKAFSEVFKDVDEVLKDFGDDYYKEKYPYSDDSTESESDADIDLDSLNLDLMEGFYQMKYPMPACNFSADNVDEHNLGYAKGVTKTGYPFVAELWQNEDEKNVTFYMPVIDEFMELVDKPLINKATGTKTFSYTKESKCYWILDIGLEDCGVVDDLSVLNAYVDFLRNNDLLIFVTDVLNGYGFLLKDLEGNFILGFNVTIISENGEEATTPLQWTPFQTKPKKIFRIK